MSDIRTSFVGKAGARTPGLENDALATGQDYALTFRLFSKYSKLKQSRISAIAK